MVYNEKSSYQFRSSKVPDLKNALLLKRALSSPKQTSWK